VSEDWILSALTALFLVLSLRAFILDTLKEMPSLLMEDSNCCKRSLLCGKSELI